LRACPIAAKAVGVAGDGIAQLRLQAALPAVADRSRAWVSIVGAIGVPSTDGSRTIRALLDADLVLAFARTALAVYATLLAIGLALRGIGRVDAECGGKQHSRRSCKAPQGAPPGSGLRQRAGDTVKLGPVHRASSRRVGRNAAMVR
jgi:hypothetical protein